MPFVLDASATFSWTSPDEQNPVARRAGELLITLEENALVPALWWFEVRNILIVNERRGRITPAKSALFLEQLAIFPISIVPDLDSPFLLDLARSHKLTVYDAAYLALAIAKHLPLATLDKALASAATSAGVALLA